MICTLLHHKKCLPNIFADYFCKNSAIHSYETRCADKLHISYARTDVMNFQIGLYGPKLRNSIDPAIVNLVIGILLNTNYIKSIYSRNTFDDWLLF